MHCESLISNGETVLIMVPFVVMMLIVMFRLDERFATPKSVSSHASDGAPRCFCDMEADSESALQEPDSTSVGVPLP